MFRRLTSSLPKDPVFPEDLEALGYFRPIPSMIPKLLNITQLLRQRKGPNPVH
jgi:hypothetical protein